MAERDALDWLRPKEPRKPYLGRPAGCWCLEGEHELWCPHWGKPRVWVYPDQPEKEHDVSQPDADHPDVDRR